MNGQDSSHRYAILGAILSVFPVVIIFQMVRIQITPNWVETTIEKREDFTQPFITVEPARGQIYDRRGSLLAGNQMVYEVGVELQDVENPQTIAQTVAALLEIDYEDLLSRASIEPSTSAVYSRLVDNVPPDEIEKLQTIIDQMDAMYTGSKDKNTPSLSGLVYTPHLGRTYPEETLASNILGFVNAENQGFFGVEEQFNALLSGKSKTVRVPLDPMRVKRTT